jgi:hypothetical protein
MTKEITDIYLPREQQNAAPQHVDNRQLDNGVPNEQQTNV